MTKILLVEDSKFLRMATERALARAGYIVSTANDGAKAIEQARSERPDVILLDMLLPGITGPDVLKVLKEDARTAGIPVVAFTGLSQKKQCGCRRMERAHSWRNRHWNWIRGVTPCWRR